MEGLELPSAISAEIIDLLQTLKRLWPNPRTVIYRAKLDLSNSPASFENFILAVQWLEKQRLVSFKALMIKTEEIAIIDSFLTKKGQDYTNLHQCFIKDVQ